MLVALDQVAGSWLKAQPSIAAPIASATSLGQAEELVAALKLNLTQAQLDLHGEVGA